MRSLVACLILALPLAAAAQSPTLAPRVRVETSAGAFVMELDAVRAPLTVENILRYVRDGFYDGLVIHRVAANFVVQGGGYDARYAERPTRGPIPNESGNGLSNTRGSVGLARGESPHSGTSQFYVNLVDNLGLNPLPSRWGYVVFGRIVEGMDVVDRIGHVATGAAGPFPAEVPLQQILIERAYVIGEQATAPPRPAAGGTAASPDDAGTTATEAATADETANAEAPDASGEPAADAADTTDDGVAGDASQ